MSKADSPLENLSTVALVALTPPSDDSGAETYDRYDWQAAMAAAHVVVAMYLAALESGSDAPGTQGHLICEHHEDWCAAQQALLR